MKTFYVNAEQISDGRWFPCFIPELPEISHSGEISVSKRSEIKAYFSTKEEANRNANDYLVTEYGGPNVNIIFGKQKFKEHN